MRIRKWLCLLLMLLAVACPGGTALAGGHDPFFETRLGPTPEPNLVPVTPVSPGGVSSWSRSAWDWMRENGAGLGSLGLALLLGLGLTFGLGAAPGGDNGKQQGAPKEPGLWDRFTGWMGRKWHQVKDFGYDARAWVKHVALPWMLYGLQAFGLYSLGLFIEVVGGVTTFGLHSLLSSGLSRLGLGTDLNEIDDYWFQSGRRAAGPALMLIGLIEMGFGLLGEGAGLLVSLTGIGAPVGVPAMAVSAGLVAAGGLTFGRGLYLSRQTDAAVRRTGGRTVAKRPDLKLLSEQEVRKLLGPHASDKAVAQFMRFQEYAAAKLGSNLDKARVRQLLEQNGSLRDTLVKWIDEVGPQEAAAIFTRYTGRRQVLGAITEHRLAARLAAEKDIVWMKVVPHTNHRGADLYFVERISNGEQVIYKTWVADAKGSFSGMNITNPSAFTTQRMEATIAQLRNELRTARLEGLISDDLYRTLYMDAANPNIAVGTGGTAGMTTDAAAAVQEQLGKIHIKVDKFEVIPLN